MIDALSEHMLVALIGLGGGILLGMAARIGRFCTFGAIEDSLYGGSTLRLRMWGLAIGLSIIGSFSLIALGLFDPTQTLYLSVPWLPHASVIGGLMFGYGMALAGNCGYGAIARLGGGDLRAFVIVMVMGISAYATFAGPMAWVREALFAHTTAPSPPAGLAHLAERKFGLSANWIGFITGALIVALSLLKSDLFRDGDALFWSCVVALAILSGWAGTTWVASTGFEALPVTSHTFSAPIGDTLMYVMQGSARPISFGVGSVFGVALGSFAGSLIKGHFRWEACEDPRELRRQITGAVLMGIGAVIATGCTVGQGLSAFSVLSYSAPVTFAAIYVGAALGLRQLIEGFQPAE